MNIMLFVSSDFKKLTTGTYKCDRKFFYFYVIIDILPVFLFGLGYSIVEYITRRFQPQVTEYVYNRQRSKVKMIGFNSPQLKGLIIAVDGAHIATTIALHSQANNSADEVAVCKEEFPTYYIMAIIYISLGYMAFARLAYLIFPHLIGG